MAESLMALCRHADRAPDAVAFRDDRGAATRRQILRRIGAVARQVAGLEGPLGLLATSDTDGVATMLGCLWAGKTVVPLPSFFSPAQLEHVVRDAGAIAVLAVGTAPAAGPGVAAIEATRAEADPPPLAEAWRLVAYSSGTTGAPKGVMLQNRQIDRVAGSLAAAIDADARDRYLSVLPLALLLEQVAAVHVPLLVGGQSTLSQALPALALRGDGQAIAAAIHAGRPTVLSLVPQVLGAWAAALGRRGERAPDCLRVVAVGGAPLAAGLARAAEGLGIPVYEGYGLTECGSVVALNRAGANRPGTVGKPLDGVTVEIEDDEIVVKGETVMEGYLHGPRANGVWRTGDIGAIDATGHLVVRGRKDAMLVTSLGRNIHPEWIEAMLQEDPRIALAVLCTDGGPWPVAVLELSAAGRRWMAEAQQASPLRLVQECAAAAPDYARPRRVVVAGEGELRALLTANGRPRRSAIAARFVPPLPAALDGSESRIVA